ncbi:MAG: hypothetical protein F6K19_23660 [Cyanothece sp. SIO1E1]|nr:hypothetical protein [Cyanothece sp. SIO1E1]
MDSLQEQIVTLNTKVDALHQLIEQLDAKIVDALSQSKLTESEPGIYSQLGSSVSNRRHSNHRGLDATLEHKDILVDNVFLDADSQSVEKELAPEIQIQRLTAQLTAAYNRIAALEEQLLSRRVY